MPSGSFYASSKGENKREREMRATRAQHHHVYTRTHTQTETEAHVCIRARGHRAPPRYTQTLLQHQPPPTAGRCHLSGKPIRRVEGRLAEVKAEVSLWDANNGLRRATWMPLLVPSSPPNCRRSARTEPSRAALTAVRQCGRTSLEEAIQKPAPTTQPDQIRSSAAP